MSGWVSLSPLGLAPEHHLTLEFDAERGADAFPHFVE
jgi:hypothetical protein